MRVMLPEALEEELKIEEIPDGVKIQIAGKKVEFCYPDLGKAVDDQKQTMVKLALLKAYQKDYVWGGLMGVRPSKIVRRFLKEGFSYKEVLEHLEHFYLVKKEKAKILVDIVKKEESFLHRGASNLYVGIPFCPTKCSYCSFASYEISGGVGRYYKEFVNTLEKEIRFTGEQLRKQPQRIESVYFGGGTPSTLTEEDLERVLKVFREEIDFSFVREFTFEAGREDSITLKKLEILKKYGVDRVSLNPQSFQEKTLERVHRKFNRRHFEEVYEDCKRLGFILNMDFILGLPEETTEDILDTLEQLKQFDVENITIHSLAFKRASKLAKGSQEREEIDRKKIEEKISSLMREKKLEPYYLYRQKNMLDWGENIGYAKIGTESIFNMEMIEENQNTIALGGGGISKVVVAEENGHDYIERFVNPKDPALYIREMEERQKQKFALFEKYRKEKNEV
ncbi:coproporphyrinogen III oxidase [Fusobacterium gonidiaformans]|uniref:coproporphyrinogen III oxidase n=1 Tax=Fusobacterium gonidiaformans TaxID=849 RepID=UPI00307F0212